MSGKSLDSDRGKKTSTQIVKDPLSFDIWISRNGQPDCDDDRIICVAISLLCYHRKNVLYCYYFF